MLLIVYLYIVHLIVHLDGREWKNAQPSVGTHFDNGGFQLGHALFFPLRKSSCSVCVILHCNLGQHVPYVTPPLVGIIGTRTVGKGGGKKIAAQEPKK